MRCSKPGGAPSPLNRAVPTSVDTWCASTGSLTDRDQAEKWRGVMLSAPPIDDDDGTLWVHQLVGAVVVDQHGTQHSTVVALIENPASDLLELANGRLVPLVFMTAFQPGVRIDVDVPAGLLDDDLDAGEGPGVVR